MAAINVQTIGTFALQVLMQLTAIAMLPLSKGFTRAGPTLVCVLAIVASVYLLARLTNSGVNLSTLIPWAATMVPLASIAMGMLLFGETASPMKVSLLVLACLVVAAAGRFE
jgi:multidrug transporter EmrE-like cation transporter